MKRLLGANVLSNILKAPISEEPISLEGNHYSKNWQAIEKKSGAERDRTVDLLNAIQALSQLSYSPNRL